MSGTLNRPLGYLCEPLELDTTERQIFAGLSLVAIRHPDTRTLAHVGELAAAIIGATGDDAAIAMFDAVGYVASRLSGTVRR